jgi:hypothetical protein
MPSSNWIRVTREKPCPVCGKPDWCLLSADAGAAICARVESPKKCNQAGWLHRLTERSDYRPRTVVLRTRECIPDLTEQAREYAAAATPSGLSRLAMDLGVTVDSLQAFQVGWSNHHRAWTHPMRDVSSRVTGIRLRKPDGNKFSVKGGKEALFLPSAWPSDCTILLVTEGASDALAAFTMGFLAVAGRPSCTGGRPHIVALVRQHKPALVAIVADQDAPGQRGAVELASRLALHCRDVRVVTPPSKDLRAWLLSGATATDLQQLIHSETKHKLEHFRFHSCAG